MAKYNREEAVKAITSNETPFGFLVYRSESDTFVSDDMTECEICDMARDEGVAPAVIQRRILEHAGINEDAISVFMDGWE